ncbi:hypothetical protein BJX96DRAFT_172201 [Aspergillus floccosus]
MFMGNAATLVRQTIPLEAFAVEETLSDADRKKDMNGPELLSPFPDECLTVISQVAHGIRAKFQSVPDEYIRHFLAYLQAPTTNFTVILDSEDFYISNWRDDGVYDSGLGHPIGRPMRMRAPDGVTDGLVYIMPKRGERESAPWEIYVSLNEDTMAHVLADPLWLSFVDKDESGRR